jgi:membrane-bound lytic murein transglycosylase D
MRLGSAKEFIKNNSLRFLVAGCVAVSAPVWMDQTQASIDPDPMPHNSALEIHPDVFPVPIALEDNVAFWRKVFARWHLNQVVLHDTDYPALIYRVIDLKGDAKESFTRAQRKRIERLTKIFQRRLRRVAAAAKDPASLSADDRALRQHIIDAAGRDALAGAAKRLRSQRGLRERFRRGLEMSGRYDRAFREVFREEGVPGDLAYLPHVESSFQNRARSSVGAAGMWQFTRSAGRLFMKINRAVDQRMDPIAAARGAAQYLRQAYELLGSWPLAITSYNHGIRGMMRAKDEYGEDFSRIVEEYNSRTFGFASRNFYAEFLAARDIARNRGLYFPKGVDMQQPLALDSVVLDRPLRSRQIARYYGIRQRKLAALNPSWRWRAIRNYVAIPAGTEVWLPAGTLSQLSDKQVAAIAQSQGGDEDPAASSPVNIYHIVHRNESLSTIADRYDLSVKTLRALNDMAPGHDLIRVGQKLRVREAVEPVVNTAGRDVIVHVVRKGDSAWQIASNYGIPVKQLLVTNQLTRHSVLRPGQRLDIPVAH